MTIAHAILLFAAAVVAGVLNSVAGGGTFFTFPALLFTGVPPIHANATSTVAVWPGSVASARAYRKRLPKSPQLLVPLIAASLAGGLVGAELLLHTPPHIFLHLIPFLLFAATLLFTLSTKISRWAYAEEGHARPSWISLGGVTLLQFLTATYGGYFGAGMGILMLSFLALLPLGDIHTMNSVKTVLTSMANGVALVTFIAARIILWPQGILMLSGAVLGGYGGAHYAQKLNPRHVRAFVVATGFTMSAIFFLKYK